MARHIGAPKMKHTPSPDITAQDDYLNIRQVKRLTGLSDSAIRIMEREYMFPLRVDVEKRNVFWIKSEVELWLYQKVLQRPV